MITRIIDKLSIKKTLFSYEVFPPKPTFPIETIYNNLDSMFELDPDYISVTYSAGGGGNNSRTLEIAKYIKNHSDVLPLAHLTCVNSTKNETINVLNKLKSNNIKNILALRGDKIENSNCVDFNYASDLISFIKENYGDYFTIAGACYPEGHMESRFIEDDIENLKHKCDLGIDLLITQLFFDNDILYDFIDKIASKNINVPITAGIMPVTNGKQITRIAQMSGAKIPCDLKRGIEKYGDSKIAMRDFGIAYASKQISDLLAYGIRGVHLYTMNNPYVAIKVKQNIRNLLEQNNNM